MVNKTKTGDCSFYKYVYVKLKACFSNTLIVLSALFLSTSNLFQFFHFTY